MIVAIGEAMVELAPAGPGLFRQGFAGDTLNTAWYLAALTGQKVRYLSAVGDDPLSGELLEFMARGGIDTAHVARLPGATLGLYLITLTGAERSFTYWRGQSAARRLAEDWDRLGAALSMARLAYLSGITLAILPPPDRDRLFDGLTRFRDTGGLVAFDPNIRLRLWPDRAEMVAALNRAQALADVSLPSFEDEAAVFADASPLATAQRIAALGAGEVVVKNGPAPALVWQDGTATEVAAPPVSDARDTTGAGDSFNAGYLAARLAGVDPLRAAAAGHVLAAEVIRHPGALLPEDALAPFRKRMP